MGKKLNKLREYIEKKHEEVYPKLSGEPVQYWMGGDWQIQGVEKTLSSILKKIDELNNN